MTRGMAWLLGVVFLVAAAGLVIGLDPSAQAQSVTKLKGDPVRGAEQSGVCAACHGRDGMGYPEGIPRIVGQSSAYVRAQLNEFRRSARLRAGDTSGEIEGTSSRLISVARSYSGKDDLVLAMTDQDIADLAAYFATLECKPTEKPQPARSPIVNRCEVCHKGNGSVVSRNIPSLASQNAVYLSRQLKLYRLAKTLEDIDLMAEGTTRFGRTMFTQTRWLTDGLIKDISRYYESVPCK